LKYAAAAHTGTNRAHQKWMLARMKDLILPRDSSGMFGALNKEDYERVGKELVNNGLIKELPDFNAFYAPADRK